MLSKIAQQANLQEYMPTHFVQALSEKQLNAIKKAAMIASLAIGIALGIYVLYRVVSSCFRKTTSDNDSNSQQNVPKIDLQNVKAHNSPSTSTTSNEPPSETLSTPINLPQTTENPSDEVILPPHPPLILPTLPTDDTSQSVDVPLNPPTIEPLANAPVESEPEPVELSEVEKQYNLLAEQATTHPNGMTVLHLIVQKFNAIDANPDEGIALIDFTLTKGIEIDALDKHKRTPLHECQNAAIVEHLLQRNANPNVQDSIGKTPLHCSLRLKVVQALYDKGAKFDILDYRYRTPLELLIEEYIDFPCSKDKQEIIKFLIEKGAKFNPDRNQKGELLKKAFQTAIDPSGAFVTSSSKYDARKNCLALAKDLITLGADLKTSNPTGALLVKSLTQGIACSDKLQDDKAFYFTIADELAPLSLNLAQCDPKGSLLKMALNKVIDDVSTLQDAYWRDYYLKLADKLSTMGSVSLSIADPKGKLLRKLLQGILNEAIKQHPSNEPSFFDAYYQVADKLIQMGATLAVSDPDAFLLKDTIYFAGQKCEKKERDFCLVIAKELVKRGATLNPDQIDSVNKNLKMTNQNSDNNALAQGLIEAGLPLEIVVANLTLEKWKEQLGLN